MVIGTVGCRWMPFALPLVTPVKVWQGYTTQVEPATGIAGFHVSADSLVPFQKQTS